MMIWLVDDVAVNVNVRDLELTASFPSPITVVDRRGGVKNVFDVGLPHASWSLDEILQVADVRRTTSYSSVGRDRSEAGAEAIVSTIPWRSITFVILSAVAVLAVAVATVRYLRKRAEADWIDVPLR